MSVVLMPSVRLTILILVVVQESVLLSEDMVAVEAVLADRDIVAVGHVTAVLAIQRFFSRRVNHSGHHLLIKRLPRRPTCNS